MSSSSIWNCNILKLTPESFPCFPYHNFPIGSYLNTRCFNQVPHVACGCSKDDKLNVLSTVSGVKDYGRPARDTWTVPRFVGAALKINCNVYRFLVCRFCYESESVHPELTWGSSVSSAWAAERLLNALTRDQRRLRVSGNWVLRRLFVPKMEEKKMIEKITREEPNRLYPSSFIWLIISRRKRWTGP
jgi:hypothetical protein